jgi:hypothetical protein
VLQNSVLATCPDYKPRRGTDADTIIEVDKEINFLIAEL